MYIRYSVWFQEIYILPPWKVIDKSEGGGGGKRRGYGQALPPKYKSFKWFGQNIVGSCVGYEIAQTPNN